MLDAMKKQNSSSRIALLAFACCVVVVSTASAERYGLVIGVGDYADSEILRLPSSRLDACRMATVFHDELGVDVERLTLLCDELATRDRIETAIREELTEKMTDDDEVVIYFSGHLHRSKDKDVGLMPHDATLCSTQNRIYRAQLHQWLEGVSGKVVLIIDSCHAEGMGGEELPSHVAVLASCRAEELCWITVKHGSSVYTHFLAKAIRDAASKESPPVTLSKVHERAAVEVTRYVREKFQTYQTPPVARHIALTVGPTR